MWCASSTITRSKAGAGSSESSPLSLRDFVPAGPKIRSESNSENGRIAFSYCSGHSPSRSVSCKQWRRSGPSRGEKFSSKRFISACHFLSATSAFGQMTRMELMSILARSSLIIRPASMVLPTPTSSAISKRGLSERISFKTGRYW